MTERLHFHFSPSCIGEGNSNPLQYSCLENPRDSGAWWAAIYGVAQIRTLLKQLSSSSSSFVILIALILGFHLSEKEPSWPYFWMPISTEMWQKYFILKQIVMGNENWTPYNNVEEIMGQVKWTMTNPTKGRSLLKESDFVNMVGFLYSEFLPENQTIPTVLLPTKPTESNTWWKASRNNKQKNALSSTRIMLDHLSIWWPGKNCYSLAGKFWFTHCIYKILQLQFS